MERIGKPSDKVNSPAISERKVPDFSKIAALQHNKEKIVLNDKIRFKGGSSSGKSSDGYERWDENYDKKREKELQKRIEARRKEATKKVEEESKKIEKEIKRAAKEKAEMEKEYAKLKKGK